jgi:hypothetical protein
MPHSKQSPNFIHQSRVAMSHPFPLLLGAHLPFIHFSPAAAISNLTCQLNEWNDDG